MLRVFEFYVPERSLRFIQVAHLPYSQQFVFWINIPRYQSSSVLRFMDSSSFFSCLPSSFPLLSSLLLSPPLPFLLHLLYCTTHTTEDEAGLHTCLWGSFPIAETEREREGERGGAVLVDVSSDIKRRGEGNGLDVITQGCCCRQEWGGSRVEVVTENKQGRLSDKRQWLPPRIAVQSMAKQIASVVQHNRGKQAQLLWEESKLRLNEGKCFCSKS